MIQSVNLGQIVRIYYYRPNNLASGSNIRFDAWDENGNVVIYSEVGTEIGSRGLYYYDLTMPLTNGYVVGVGRNSNGRQRSPFTFKVGNPTSQKLFFYADLEFALPPNYRLYDITGDVVQQGSVLPVEDRFYYVTLSDEAIALDKVFFEVAAANTVDKNVPIKSLAYQYTSAGGLLIGDCAVYKTHYAYNPTDGLILGGSATAEPCYIHAPTEGIVTSGEANYQPCYKHNSSGSIILSNTASYEPCYNHNSTNGIILGGEADGDFNVSIYTYTGVGGLILGGGSNAVGIIIPSKRQEVSADYNLVGTYAIFPLSGRCSKKYIEIIFTMNKHVTTHHRYVDCDNEVNMTKLDLEVKDAPKPSILMRALQKV